MNKNTGILIYKDGKYFVSKTEITILNTAIIGDKVRTQDNEVVEVFNRSTSCIVGVLKLSARVKYGTNKRGVPIYLFNPYHHKYPKFLVCSNKRSSRDVFCTISFNKFDKVRNKHFGKLKQIIGEVKNYHDEIQYILTQYWLNFPRSSTIVRKNSLSNQIKIDVTKDADLQLKIRDYKVVSIDPIGCKDVDDAFHFSENITTCEVGIHIADVLYYLNRCLDNIIKARFFTIYYDGGKNNMFPNIYSEKLMSLLQDKNRYALSVIYKYNKYSGELIETKVKRSIVKNYGQYSYDYIDDLFKKDRYKNPEEKMIINLKRFMTEILGLEVDSHNLIEYFMIKTNDYIGELLFDNFGNKTVIRKHVSSEEQLTESVDSDLEKFLKLRMMKKATYQFANDNKSENKHYGLNLMNYVHFTSPIRRYNDILVHSLVYKYLGIEPDYIPTIDDFILEEMNYMEKNINKCERKLNRLKLIRSFELINKIEPIIEDGFVTSLNEKWIYVYIPKYKLEEKIRLIPLKFQELYKVELCNNNKLIKVYKNDELEVKYKLYQKLKVEITPFLNESLFQNKIKIICF